MFILAIIVTTVVIGYITSRKKRRLPMYAYMIAAFLGAVVGAFLSFGDSKLFLDYQIFNIWTMPLIFSVLAALIILYSDHGKMVITIVLIVLMLAGAVGIVYIDSNGGEDSKEIFPPHPTELDRVTASRLSEDECVCWDGVNNVCLPEADCI